MTKFVVFDLGGVLIELSGVSTFQSWIGDRLTTAQVWERWLTSPAVRAFETGRSHPDRFADQVITEFGLPVSRTDFLTAFEACVELVQQVAQTHVCVTLCNTNSLHWQRFVEEMHMAHLFERHFASHLIGKLKPDPEVFEHLVDSLGCAPREILFLDDQPLNVRAATRAGVTARQVEGVADATRALADAGVLMPGSNSKWHLANS